MDISPVKFLVLPRIIAFMIMGPLLTIFANVIGIIGGAVVSYYKIGVNFHRFYKGAFDFIGLTDLYTGLLKAFVFAITIATIACSEGLSARQGSVGVGNATTKTVVLSFLFILIFDYFLTYFFFGFGL